MLHFLSREERYQCDRQCDEVLSDAMAALLAFDGDVSASEWRVIGRRDQFTVHRAVRAATDGKTGGGSARMNVLATGFLHGTLAQIAEGLSAETDEELLATEALLSGSQVAVTAAAVLNVAERPSPRARFRFAGVKWYAWTRESAHDADGNNDNKQQPQQQELLTYERMGVMHDDEDREVAYHVVRSMDRPEWPLFVPRAPGLRRTDMALCFLFRAVCDDLVECLVAGSYQARASSSSQRAADVTVAERVLTVSRSLRSYEAKKLSRLMDKARDRPVNMSKNCLRCGARRTVLDSHRNCGICKKSVCSNCRQSKRIFKLNKNLCVPETAAFCNACLTRARLPSAVAKILRAERAQAEKKKSKPEPVALRRERVSLPANLEYKNYDRLLESYAQRRRPRASTSAIPSSSSLLTSSSNESFGGSSSSSDDVGSGHEPPLLVAAMPNRQLLELRRERETVLSFPVARTIVQEDLYLSPGNENSSAASNQAEAVFRHHRERQQQLEEFARPNPLHMRLLEEQERRRAMRQAVGGGDRPEPTVQRSEDKAAAVVRRRAMTVPSHGPDARGDQDEHIERAAATSPWSVAMPRANADAFRSDLYARF